MGPSLGDAATAGLERPCDPREWVDATRPADGLELFRARLRGRPFSRHQHDVYAIGVTEEGIQAFAYRGTVERSLPGQVFVLHPDEPHDGRTDDPVLARVVRTAFAHASEPLAIDYLMLQLAGGVLRASAASRTSALRYRVDLRAVERGRDFLRSRLTVVNSSDIEAVTGLDRYQFARQFRAVYGTSPYRYSVMRRLDMARCWLRDARPLAETAVEAGFADQSHFTRTFKAAFGMTPGRYVKLCAGPCCNDAGPPDALATLPKR